MQLNDFFLNFGPADSARLMTACTNSTQSCWSSSCRSRCFGYSCCALDVARNGLENLTGHSKLCSVEVVKVERRTLLAASRKIPKFSPSAGDQLKVPTAVQLSLCELPSGLAAALGLAFAARGRSLACMLTVLLGQIRRKHLSIGRTVKQLAPYMAVIQKPHFSGSVNDSKF